MTDKQLAIVKEALMEADLREMAIIDALPDEEITFSEKYKNAISKLMNNTRRSTRSFSKKATVILVAVLTSLILAMSVSAIRDPFVKFVVKSYESFISIFVDDKDAPSPNEISAFYVPSYIPKEYSLHTMNKGDRMLNIIWAKDEHSKISLLQAPYGDGLQVHIDKNGENYLSYKTKLNTEFFYEFKNNHYNIIWTDKTFIYSLTCPDTIELSEIEKIIDSMEPTKS